MATTDPQPEPFRFFDNRQKYLAFVNTCNEKAVVGARASKELAQLLPRPPALRMFDAGMGDATVLTRLVRAVHHSFPTVPLLAVAKEISLEDVRLGLEKMPDRFFEHPHTVLVVTNLSYKDAPNLLPSDPQKAAALNWQEVRLSGSTSAEFEEQIEALAPSLAYGWETTPHPTTGNPTYVRPSVLVVYRQDHEFLLDGVIPRPRQYAGRYDFILASQPWRARMSATFKAERILAPLARSLAPGGRLMTIQSIGRDPALEVVQALWPQENPFQVDRHALLAALTEELGDDAASFDLGDPSDDRAIFRYEMHTLPSEIGDRIGTSTTVRGVERRHLRQPDRGRAPGPGDRRRLLPPGDARRPAEVRRAVVQRRGLRRHAPLSLLSSPAMPEALRPLFDQVVIKELEPDRMRKSGLLVPQGTQDLPPNEGIVLAAGDGPPDLPDFKMPVRPGDHVVFPRSAGVWVEIEDERLLVCRVREILGVIESTPTQEES